MTGPRFAALLALALPLAAACTANETAPGAADAASASPEATMTTPASDPARTPAAGETPQATPAPSEPEIDSCDASRVRARWTGALPTDGVRAEISKAVGQRPIRYYTDGDAITMDYSEARLNVVLGKDGRIAEFRCG